MLRGIPMLWTTTWWDRMKCHRIDWEAMRRSRLKAFKERKSRSLRRHPLSRPKSIRSTPISREWKRNSKPWKRTLTRINWNLSLSKKKTQRNVDKANEYKTLFQRSFTESGGKKIIPGKGTEEAETLEQLEDLVERREEILWEKIDDLVERIEQDSVRDAIMTFGNPPYYVKMTIEFPMADPEKDPSEWQRTQGTLVFELAPLEKMPHAVNFFLQQIHHKLWDGCAFVINAMHILQAGPHRHIKAGNYEANAVDLMDKFLKAELDKIAFQEYHEDYPHAKYTLGLAGRPGGPDFYINKIDNSVNHGPGGQDHHDLHEEADPCFGKLIRGKRVIEELSQVPVDHAKGGLFLETVTIVNAVIAYDEQFEEEAD
mmetsp:Transcript_15205/g.31880  ORF Transcript_15205/g.31880 Transcript_15205/m.31880 type:complete len:371 (+) Transcript_15205:513-1625(+)